MWVILLWALTSPGQEEAVYSFLVNGKTTETQTAAGSLPDGQAIAESEAAVSWDAQHAPFILLQPGTAVVQLLQVFVFANHSSTSSISSFAATAAVSQQARLLAVSVLPNAP